MTTKVQRLAACLSLASVLAAAAQTVPALINYQGQLTDANGTNLPTADYKLTFRIYNAETGGTLVWGPQVFDGNTSLTGHKGKVPVVQGYFNLMLGPVDTNGLSIMDAFTAPDRYVEVQVEANSPITPRQRILAAPFAFKATSAEKLTVPGGNSTALSVAGTGNVGIGTTTPRERLDVEGGDFLLSNSATSASEAHQMAISTYAEPNSALRLGYFYNPGSHSGGVLQALDAGQPTKLLLNPQGGSLGVGTTAPQRAFHINGPDMLLTSPNSPGFEINTSADNSPASARAFFGIATVNGGWMDNAAPNDTVLNGRGGGNLLFGTGGAEKVRISNQGYVGIGTSNPQANLEIAAGWGSGVLSLNALGSPSSGYGNQVLFRTTGVTRFVLGLNPDDNFYLDRVDDGLGFHPETLTVQRTTGNIGIGTSNPTALLHADGGSGNAVLRLETSGAGKGAYVLFKDNAGSALEHVIGQETSVAGGLLVGDTARALVLAADGANPIQFGIENRVVMTLAPAGMSGADVGIGTKTPQGKLDVSGRILRHGQPLSSAGITSHGQSVAVPWGTTDDWNIFVSPRAMGDEIATQWQDDCLLMIECSAVKASSTTWLVTARYLYKFSPSDRAWYNGTANYLLVPR